MIYALREKSEKWAIGIDLSFFALPEISVTKTHA
jgi:hypothetical protein